MRESLLVTGVTPSGPTHSFVPSFVLAPIDSKGSIHETQDLTCHR